MQCSRCAKAKMVEIRMTVAGEPLTFRRCGKCEARAWYGADGPLPLTAVLDLARAR